MSDGAVAAPDVVEPLAPGSKVRFALPAQESRYWWNVRLTDGRYTILTRQAQFRPKGEVFYTIVDHVEGIRGAADTLGNGWDRHMSDKACQSLMDALTRSIDEPVHFDDPDWWPHVQISHRNRIDAEVAEVRP